MVEYAIEGAAEFHGIHGSNGEHVVIDTAVGVVNDAWPIVSLGMTPMGLK